MKTKTNFRLALALVLLAAPLTVAGLPRASGEPMSGRWIVDFDKDGWLELTLKRRSDGHGNWTSSNDYKVSDFQGLSRPAGTAEAPAHFQLVRDAGTIAFDGTLGASGGSGSFSFAGNSEYVAALGRMGYRTPDSDELFSLALHDVSRQYIQELDALGYKKVPLDDLLSMRIHDAGPEFIRELKPLGYTNVAVDDLVSMKIHGADAEFIRDLKGLGYTNLTADDLVSMRIHEATPEFVRALKSLGYTSLPADDLVSMRIHGATPEFVKELQSLGYGGVSVDDLVSMRIHSVTPDYIRERLLQTPQVGAKQAT